MSYSEEILEVIASGDIATQDSVFYHMSLDAGTRASEYLIDFMRICTSELVARIYEDRYGLATEDTPQGRKRYIDIHEEVAAAHFRSCVKDEVREWANEA